MGLRGKSESQSKTRREERQRGGGGGERGGDGSIPSGVWGEKSQKRDEEG